MWKKWIRGSLGLAAVAIAMCCVVLLGSSSANAAAFVLACKPKYERITAYDKPRFDSVKVVHGLTLDPVSNKWLKGEVWVAWVNGRKFQQGEWYFCSVYPDAPRDTCNGPRIQGGDWFLSNQLINCRRTSGRP